VKTCAIYPADVPSEDIDEKSPADRASTGKRPSTCITRPLNAQTPLFRFVTTSYTTEIETAGFGRNVIGIVKSDKLCILHAVKISVYPWINRRISLMKPARPHCNNHHHVLLRIMAARIIQLNTNIHTSNASTKNTKLKRNTKISHV